MRIVPLGLRGCHVGVARGRVLGEGFGRPFLGTSVLFSATRRFLIAVKGTFNSSPILASAICNTCYHRTLS